MTFDKGVCSTMSSALLAHKKLAKAFNSWVFAMNPYDPCVWNKMKLSKQITIMFHMDNLIMSHESSIIVAKHIDLLGVEFRAKDPLTEIRCKTHECLGMIIDFSLKEVLL